MKKIMMNIAVFAAAASLAVLIPFTSYAKEIDDVEFKEEETIVEEGNAPEEFSNEENTEEVASAEEEGTIEEPNYEEDADL